MEFSVESRAISNSELHSDIFLTVCHLPVRLEKDLEVYFPEWLGMSKSFAVTYEDFVGLSKSEPSAPGHNGKYRGHWSEVPSWLNNSNDFVKQCLLTQLSKEKISILADESRSQITVQNLQRRNISHHSLEHWLEMLSGSEIQHRYGILKSELLATYSMLLDGLLLNPEALDRAENALTSKLNAFEVPFSHSPEIGSITLQKLLEGGIRSACLVPLAAGIYGGYNHLLAGESLIGFELVASGGGMTICAISSLWVADKIMKGIKSIDQNA